MTAIAQRRVAGATAIMILLYLLQVALFAPSAGADHINPTGPVGSNCVEFQANATGSKSPADYPGVSINLTSWGGDLKSLNFTVSGLAAGQYVDASVKYGINVDEFGPYLNGSHTITITEQNAISHVRFCVFVDDTPPPGSADLTIEKVVVVLSGIPATTSFAFTVTDQTDFTLEHGEDESFTYDLGQAASVNVTVTEKAIAESGWTTAISCDSGVSGGTSVEVTLEDEDDVTCTVTNTFSTTPPPPPPPPTTTTTQPTTTTTEAVTTTTAEAEVLGTTITTVPEVSAETLPFTGFEAGDTARLGLLAILAGGLMLFAVRGKKEEEGAATDIGGWSNL
jgi:hypothetical protein